MANTMRVLKKIEAPRPLKTTTTSQLLAIKLPQDSTQVTADSLISIAESIASVLVNKSSDVGLQSNLAWLSHQLKIQGPRIEVNYRDSLNKIFVIFRNSSQDEDTNYNIRLSLLQLIELRANNWQASDGANSYYKTKTSHMHESIPMETVLSPSPEPFANASPTQLLLGPGEIVRASGKYTRPTRIPGKNYSKDEVVIRNADSGKVNPGAKERLVQITGPTEDKINHAKQLIEDTIRRNASPVRSMEQFGMLPLGECDRDSLDSLGFSTMDESVPRSLHHSRSVNDALVEEYIYTVTAGKHLLKITGDNLRYVQVAKLELDKLFASSNLDNLDEVQSSSSDERNRNSISALSDMDDIAVGFGNGFNSTKDSSTLDTSEDISLKPATERRKYFHRKSTEIKEYPDPVFDSQYKYSKDSLLMHSQSPFSNMIPRDMDKINKNNITKMKQVNVIEAIKRWRATTTNNNNNNGQMDNNNHITQHFSTTTRTSRITRINNNHHHACCGNANNNFIRNLNGNINNFY